MVSRDNLMFSLGQTIDIRDYINWIGNYSCEPYIHVCTLCCLHPFANQIFAKKWQKIATAVALSIKTAKQK